MTYNDPPLDPQIEPASVSDCIRARQDPGWPPLSQVTPHDRLPAVAPAPSARLIAMAAGQDAELVAAARKLIDLVQQHAPGAAAAIGVDLKDVSAANLRLADIEAAGTGVKVERGTFTGDIDIRGVRAGVPSSGPAKGG
jgi:hypothetical protein